MAFKTIPIKHLPSINNQHHHHHHNNNNNSYPLLPILCTLIHRQTVFQQLLQQLLSILQMILFLCLICNIYPITYIYILQNKPILSDHSRSLLVIISKLKPSTRETYIHQVQIFSFICMFYRTSSIVFFCIITVIVIHIYTIELCAIGEKKKTIYTKYLAFLEIKSLSILSNQILFLDDI